MSEIAKQIDAIIKAHLAPALRGLGFKKKGRNFRRPVSDATQVINVQASMSNVGTEGKFTVNLGLYFPAAAPFVCRYQEVEDPTVLDCPVSKRIGPLMPERQDFWWSVGSATDLDSLSRAVTISVEQYAVPWLDRFSLLKEAAAGDLRRGEPIGQAALLFAAGDRAAAVRLMTSSIQRSERVTGGWFALAVAAGLEDEYRAARAMKT